MVEIVDGIVESTTTVTAQATRQTTETQTVLVPTVTALATTTATTTATATTSTNTGGGDEEIGTAEMPELVDIVVVEVETDEVLTVEEAIEDIEAEVIETYDVEAEGPVTTSTGTVTQTAEGS